MTRDEIISRLPQPIGKINMASLVGIEKQVEWAKQIRQEIVMSLRNEILSNTNVFNYMASTDKMVEWVEEKAQIGERAVERAVEHINIKKQQYDRFVEIAAIADVMFWIDNRTDQKKNFMNKSLISKMING